VIGKPRHGRIAQGFGEHIPESAERGGRGRLLWRRFARLFRLAIE